jgi:hypothetical protein
VTALDLLGALLLVECARAITAGKYDSLSTTDKIDRLVASLSLSEAIPQSLTALKSFSDANGWTTIGQAMGEMRHGFVHPNLKRRKIVLASDAATRHEANQLMLWLIELGTLKTLNYAGIYRNRLTAKWTGEVEPVPWRTD